MDVEFKDSSGTIHTCGVEVIPSQMASIFLRNHKIIFMPQTGQWRHYVLELSVCPSVRSYVTKREHCIL